MAKFKISDVIDVYFNLKGRIGRGEFWAYGVPLSLGLYVGMALLALAPSPWGELVSLVVYAVFLWAYMGLLVKRGHDRNRPAALSILVLAARVVLAFTGGFLGSTPVILGLQGALIIYVLVDYAILPGKPGANRYGPSPSGLGNKTPLVLGGDRPGDSPVLPASSPEA
jgi:uncharacterized membrane protein YhaH (DUF805 family)